ncbi:hypothetical protein TCAL_13174, partial [Tigriopus californicus]|eukprot:TCALIF_13174-PA protein Name:"Similar to Leech-derived tryptase inhibitor C (Hirudo medicinalis)" AED:0.00 eAED:0.00 QI:67/1/0.33/1/1/0.66/3/0/162
MKNLIIFTIVLGAIFVEGQDDFQEETDEYSDGGAACECGELYQPVCGQNGQTYSNACDAECNQTGLQCEGECPCQGFPSNFATKNQRLCPFVIKKVCGDNGKTYDNACKADNDDVKIQCEGDCPCAENAAVGSDDEGCPSCCSTRSPECRRQRVDCSQCSRK